LFILPSRQPLLLYRAGYTLSNSQTPDGLGFVNFSQGGVIHLRVQYRLGAFGFLGGDAVRENGAENAGLQDQRLALKWVQKYIHWFGGDKLPRR
jgi:carboxylesterase type B